MAFSSHFTSSWERGSTGNRHYRRVKHQCKHQGLHLSRAGRALLLPMCVLQPGFHLSRQNPWCPLVLWLKDGTVSPSKKCQTRKGRGQAGCTKNPGQEQNGLGLVTSRSCPAAQQPMHTVKRRVGCRLLKGRQAFTSTNACKA